MNPTIGTQCECGCRVWLDGLDWDLEHEQPWCPSCKRAIPRGDWFEVQPDAVEVLRGAFQSAVSGQPPPLRALAGALLQDLAGGLGRCSVCGARVELYEDGRCTPHKPRKFGVRVGQEVCAGSEQRPS